MRSDMVSIQELRHLPKIVICRSDLPPNPRWRLFNYPGPNCWDLEELVIAAVESGEDSVLWREARRIWWEFHHRYHGTYKRGRPLPKFYLCWERCVELDLPESVLVELAYHFLAAAGNIYGLIPAGWRRRRAVLVTA